MADHYEWSNYTGASLDWTAEAITLRSSSGEPQACTPNELVAGALQTPIVEQMSLQVLAEALALSRYPEDVRAHPPLAGEDLRGLPSPDRVFGGRRGQSYVVWIWGRAVQIRVDSQKDDLHDTLAAIAERGIPAPYREGLPEATVEQVTRAARELAPLSCMCHTYARRTEEHGSIHTLVRIDHPFAPIEDYAEVGYCTVCYRWWTFETSGDSYYSYNYEASRFRGRLV
jgi:hypothetical protein